MPNIHRFIKKTFTGGLTNNLSNLIIDNPPTLNMYLLYLVICQYYTLTAMS